MKIIILNISEEAQLDYILY